MDRTHIVAVSHFSVAVDEMGLRKTALISDRRGVVMEAGISAVISFGLLPLWRSKQSRSDLVRCRMVLIPAAKTSHPPTVVGTALGVDK